MMNSQSYKIKINQSFKYIYTPFSQQKITHSQSIIMYTITELRLRHRKRKFQNACSCYCNNIQVDGDN